MEEEELQKRKKRKRKQSVLLEEEKLESDTFHELVEVLDELEREGKYVDVQICPECKSPKVRRVGTMSGDLWGNMGILPPKFECGECGWRARMVLKATNRKTSVKDAEIMAQASSLKDTETS